MAELLRDDPERIVQELIELSSSNRDDLERELLDLIKDPYAPGLEEPIRESYAGVDSSQDWLLRGAFGFFLFTRAAERRQFEESDTYLSDPATIEFLFDQYDVSEEFQGTSVVIHELGTTSFILLVNDRILKIIKPRYFDNPTIRRRTKEYRSLFLHYQEEHTPKVLCSKERFMVMEFVRGVTLRDYFEDIWPELPESITKVREITLQLLRILDLYARHGIHHQDLTPDNILVDDRVTDNGEKITSVHLIDFGRNYVLNERIGTTQELAQSQTFIAPEVVEGEAVDAGRALADIYSVGVVLLEALAGHRIAPFQMPDEMDRVYEEYPGLGDLLEELIDGDPDSRIFEAPRDRRIFVFVQRNLEVRLLMYEKVHLGQRRWPDLALKALSIFPLTSIGSVRRLGKELQFLQSRNLPGATNARLLFRFAIASEWAHVVVVASFMTVIFLALIKKGIGGTLSENLPGWLVAISISFVATQYYLNVFSTLTTHGVSRTTEFWLRLNSVGNAVPILVTIWVNSEWWPFAYGVGAAFVTFNNLAVHRFCVKARAEMASTFGENIPKSMDDFLDDFSGWWQVMSMFWITLWVVGALLETEVLKDVWFYAIGVAVALNWKMYWFNSTKFAPRVRVAVGRLAYGFARARRYQTMNPPIGS